MATESDVVAVINSDGDRVATWYVVISPTYPMSRLAGAWILDSPLPSLVASRLLLPFDNALPNSLASLADVSAGLFDPTATYEAVAKRIAELDARHKASPTKSGDPRASIEWPCLCQPLDWTAPPGPPPGVVDDPFTSATIGVAGWVADLADAWATVETLRLSRKHLNDGEVAARPLPVELVEARSE